MAESDLIQTDTSTWPIRDAATYRVYARAKWTDPWQLAPYLYCDHVEFGMGERMSQAQFTWRYGDVMQPGTTTWQPFGAVNLNGWYVKVEIDQPAPPDAEEEAAQPIRWYGIITDRVDRQDGAPVSPEGGGLRVPKGTQIYTALGMELLLKRTPIDFSVYQNALAGPDREIFIDRVLTFNEHDSRLPQEATRRNRTVGPGPQGCYNFTDDIAGGRYWSSADILQYLLTHLAPANLAEEIIVPFVWDSATFAAFVPDWDAPRRDYTGRTLFDAFNDLLSRRRLRSWQVVVDEPEPEEEEDEVVNRVRLVVVAINEDEIEVNQLDLGGGTLAASERQFPLDFDAALDVDVELGFAVSQQFDRVIARGARARSMAPLAYPDDTLAEDWLDTDQTSYETGPTIPGGADESAVERYFGDFRHRDELSHVFRNYRVPKEWDGRVGDGIGGAKAELLPAGDLVHSDAGDRAIYPPGLRYERHLPFGRDPFDPDVPLLPMMVFLQLPPEPATGGGSGGGSGGGDDAPRWCLAEHYGATSAIEDISESGRFWSASVEPSDHCLGVKLQIHGAPQHIIAGDDFTPSTEFNDREPERDWRQHLIVVGLVELDQYAEGIWDAPTGSATEVARILVINAGNQARQDYQTVGCPTGVDEDGQLVRSTGKYLRDDRGRLAGLAQIAGEWHARTRKACHFKFRQLRQYIKPGDLLTEVGGDGTLEDVYTVVSAVRYDLLRQETTVITDFAELDVLSL